MFIDVPLTWAAALERCPKINPFYTGLATIRDESEWRILVRAMQEVWSAPGGPPIGMYKGAWIGLSSLDAVPKSVPRDGPWQPASNWRWVDGTDKRGAALTAQMAAKCASFDLDPATPL